ncbi:MAG: DNA-3-methyladenine glycosylase family protein, partial [Rubrimonas sp.]
MRVIERESDLDEGIAALIAREPRFAQAPRPPLRRSPAGFEGMVRIVAAQQLPVAAAEVIRRRLAALGATDPTALMAIDDAALRGAGLSRSKIRSLRALAASGTDFAALRDAPQEQAVATLTQAPGVGRWTAEIYLMFCLGRADVFAPTDLALREGARMLFELPDRPAPAALDAMAEAWSPWRAVA